MNYQEILIEKIREYLSALASVISSNSIKKRIQQDKFMQKFAIELSLQNHHKNNFFVWDSRLSSDNKLFIANISEKLIEKDIKSHLKQIKEYRAMIDVGLCYYLFHNNYDYQDFLYNFCDAKYHLIINDVEKLRIAMVGGFNYVGIVVNIIKKIDKDLANKNFSKDEMVFAGVLFALVRIFLQHNKYLSSLLKVDNIDCFYQNWLSFFADKNIVKILQLLEKLTTKILSQKQFLADLLEILKLIDYQFSQNSDKTEAKEDKEIGDNNQNKKNEDVNYGSETAEYQQNKDISKDDNKKEEGDESKNQNIDYGNEEQILGDDNEILSQNSKLLDNNAINNNILQFKKPYRPFTTQFDEIIFPQKFLAKEELKDLRNQLDIKLAKLNNISKKMEIKLKRKLLAKNLAMIDINQSEGEIDRKKLSQLISNPTIENIWINKKHQQNQDIALTMLLDNSGSMRGNPIVMTALACEMIANILEKFSIKTEIIGFTTSDWRGGKSRKMWEREGSFSEAGRLNDLRHIIYKNFQQNFRNAKINLGLMLKDGILKENIDGEALLFARSRLMQRTESRKILMVISDGAPVDDSTHSSNKDNILIEHLSEVVCHFEKRKTIELVGVGICHNTDQFYRNSIVIKNLEDLGDAMIEKISCLL
ncbi:MAG: hypothetical protein LW595_01265 [Rickettsiales bacterium]|jgi:cobaltochelatase CobT|nr:hypothetical protein [Rickettsiales bacterium]